MFISFCHNKDPYIHYIIEWKEKNLCNTYRIKTNILNLLSQISMLKPDNEYEMCLSASDLQHEGTPLIHEGCYRVMTLPAVDNTTGVLSWLVVMLLIKSLNRTPYHWYIYKEPICIFIRKFFYRNICSSNSNGRFACDCCIYMGIIPSVSPQVSFWYLFRKTKVCLCFLPQRAIIFDLLFSVHESITIKHFIFYWKYYFETPSFLLKVLPWSTKFFYWKYYYNIMFWYKKNKSSCNWIHNLLCQITSSEIN